MKFVVAIDGPAASGKGTIARAVALEFGFKHLDTGLLYRCVGALVNAGADPIEAAKQLTLTDLQRDDLRGEVAGKAASKVAAIPEVRSALLEYQIRFSQRDSGAVLDGRDIGTVVCPDADVKLFITASDEVRANRRWLEEGGETGPVSYEWILGDVRERDKRDRDRSVAPLVAADDATTIDTSKMSIDEAIATALETVRRRYSAA